MQQELASFFKQTSHFEVALCYPKIYTFDWYYFFINMSQSGATLFLITITRQWGSAP